MNFYRKMSTTSIFIPVFLLAARFWFIDTGLWEKGDMTAGMILAALALAFSALVYVVSLYEE